MKESEQDELSLGRSYSALHVTEESIEETQREAEMVREFQRRMKLNREGHLHDVVRGS